MTFFPVCGLVTRNKEQLYEGSIPYRLLLDFLGLSFLWGGGGEGKGGGCMDLKFS